MEWLSYDGVEIEQLGRTITLTNYGLTLMKINYKTFEAILPYLKQVGEDVFTKKYKSI